MVKKKLAFDDIAYNLPSDILFLVLARVPVKSLLRFKCVCKAWNVMISDNEFRRTHRDQSKALAREKLLLDKHYTNEFEFRDLKTSQLVTITKGVFPPEKFRKAIVLCSCDGLLLLKNPRAYKRYVLWNPSTEEYQTLACPYSKDKHDVQMVVGCVMILVPMITSWTEKATSLRGVATLAKKISLSRGISIGGCVFWPYYIVRNSIIVYFDGKSDELKELPIPDFVGANTCFCFTSFKSCLCLYGGNKESLRLDIWLDIVIEVMQLAHYLQIFYI
ncbi:hypothetical protein P3L10_010932 [Capsicum annuum]